MLPARRLTFRDRFVHSKLGTADTSFDGPINCQKSQVSQPCLPPLQRSSNAFAPTQIFYHRYIASPRCAWYRIFDEWSMPNSTDRHSLSKPTCQAWCPLFLVYKLHTRASASLSLVWCYMITSTCASVSVWNPLLRGRRPCHLARIHLLDTWVWKVLCVSC